MLNLESQPRCGVLYVDDEVKALKYFKMAFAPRFNVFITASAAEGLEILRRERGRISIVLSDQRMPETYGAVFLGTVREEFPYLVRILTTAYTDLSDAIAAVNTGHIYQYVVKPWKIDELQMVLQRAADYFHILSERNELLALKMTTLQRILCSDRLKWLLLWTRTLPATEQSAARRALVAFVRNLPEALNPLAAARRADPRRMEIGPLLRAEYRLAAASLDSLDAFRAGGAAADSGRALRALSEALAAFPGVGSAPVETDGPGTAVIRVRAAGGAAGIAEVEAELFGLLAGRDVPALSVLLFEAAFAAALAGESLTIVLQSDAGAERTFAFRPTDAMDDPEGAIEALAEKFAASDISRL